MRSSMPEVFGWALWIIGLFAILMAVWYFWGGRTIATYETDETEE